MSTQPFSAIEVGTSRTVILVGCTGKDGRIEVLGASSNRMTGIRKGTVVNASNARTGITTAIDSLSKTVNPPERNNWLVVSGGEVASNVVVHSVLTSGGTVTPDAIANAVDGVSQTRLENRSILHTVAQDYVVKSGSAERTVQDAKTLKAESVQANVLLIHADDAAVRDLHTVVEASHLPLRGLVFSAACAARAVLTPEQRMDGVLLLDIGAGTTSYALYNGGILRTAGSLPIGGDHATNDISVAFHIRANAAEDLKVRSSSAVVGDARPEDTARVAASGMLDRERVLSLRDVNIVVNARFDELFRVVLDRVGATGYANVVLVGGCALQRGIVKVAESVFHRPCSVGSILDGTHFGAASQDPLYATAYGALYVARDELADVEQKARPRGGSLFDLFSKKGGAK